MRIEIRYASSQGPHVMEWNDTDVEDTHVIVTRGTVMMNHKAPDKTMTVTGDRDEFIVLATQLLDAAQGY